MGLNNVITLASVKEASKTFFNTDCRVINHAVNIWKGSSGRKLILDILCPNSRKIKTKKLRGTPLRMVLIKCF